MNYSNLKRDIVKINMETTIILSTEDAQKFKLFVEYYDMFSLLVSKNVFNQKSASVSLNFDHNGVLQTIHRNDILYSSRHESLH